jgi:hypothetical protein
MATHITKCLSLVKGRRIRVTKLDSCGRPVYGDTSQVVSKGFISVGFTANTSDSDEISVTNAAGEICVFDPAVTSLSGYAVEISFCEVDPELFALVTGQSVVLGGDASTVIGFDVDPAIALSASNFALELWAGSPAGDACATAGATGSYGYLLLPFLTGGILGDFTVENAAITFTLTGANTKKGNAWGKGPYPVMLAPTGINEVQRLTITGAPTAGTFTLTYAGQTTSAIAYNATAAAVQTAMEALSNIAPSDVVVTGGPGPATPYTFTFGGTLAGKDVTAMTTTGSYTGGTSPLGTITTITAGVVPVSSIMSTSVSTTAALRTIIVDLEPPASACGARPLLDASNASFTSIAGVATGLSVALTTTPAATGPTWWDFGDGTWDYVAAPGTTTHVYPQAGSYTAKATQNNRWTSTTVNPV